MHIVSLNGRAMWREMDRGWIRDTAGEATLVSVFTIPQLYAANMQDPNI